MGRLCTHHVSADTIYYGLAIELESLVVSSMDHVSGGAPPDTISLQLPLFLRKIIKKVGQNMLENEEYGKDFILPVKSQGVREITNSVMTIRVKFTAQPGTHFVIRREAYRLITEALNAQGIHYAHRKVIVDVSDFSDSDKNTPEGRKQIADVAGAAAQRVIEEDDQAAAAQSGSEKE